MSYPSLSDIDFKNKMPWVWTTLKILGLVPEFRAKFKAEICDRIYTDTSGVIFSPNHPDLYPNQLECTILISLKDPQLKIQVFFTSFDVENSNGCNNDYLEHYGKKYCGSNLDPIS